MAGAQDRHELLQHPGCPVVPLRTSSLSPAQSTSMASPPLYSMCIVTSASALQLRDHLGEPSGQVGAALLRGGGVPIVRRYCKTLSATEGTSLHSSTLAR